MNNNIKESYCSFQVSKLLKEKGFDCQCNFFWVVDKNEKNHQLHDDIIYWPNVLEQYKSPTHALVIEWLRINFNIEIIVLRYTYSGGVYQGRKYMWAVDQYDEKYNHELPEDNSHWIMNSRKSQSYNYISPQEATEAALLEILKNLI